MSDRIVTNPAILGGKRCVRGTRLSVEFMLELIASGATQGEIVQAFPQLTVSHVEAAVRYAARALKNDLLLKAPNFTPETPSFPRDFEVKLGALTVEVPG